MFYNLAQVPVYNSHSPFDGPPDAFSGSGIGTLLHRTRNVMKSVYSFAVQGGAVSTIKLLDDLGNPATLPPNALVVRTFMNWTTAATSSSSATISLGLASTTDVKNALAVASATGLVEGVQTGTMANALALGTTALGYQLQLTIAVAALTAGICNIYLEWVN